jgi:hypothetical protein
MATSMPAKIAMNRHTLNKIPLASISLYVFCEKVIDVAFSLEFAVLPVTNEPLGLLPNKWNRITAYRCAVDKGQYQDFKPAH